jgi:ketosteroid isomerase-like protein
MWAGETFMTRCVLLSAAILAASLWPAAAPAADEEIQTLEKEWSQAVIAGNVAKVDALLGKDLIYGHASGIVENKDQYMTKLRGGAQRYEAIEYHDMAVKTYGDTAVVHGHVRMAGKTKGVPFNNEVMMLHVWVKRDGRWQLAAHQTAQMPK